MASHPRSNPSTRALRSRRATKGAADAESQDLERRAIRTTVVRVVVKVDVAKMILAIGGAVALVMGVAHGVHVTIPLGQLPK